MDTLSDDIVIRIKTLLDKASPADIDKVKSDIEQRVNPKIKIEDGYEEKPAVYSMFFLLFLCFLIGLFSPLIFEFLSVYFKSFEARYNFSYIKSILWGISSFYLVFLSLFVSFFIIN